MRYAMSRLSLLIAVLMMPLLMAARDSVEVKPLRPVMSAYMIEGGGARLVNTYLTPLKYSGWSAAFNYERMQAMKFSPDRWVMQLRAVSRSTVRRIPRAMPGCGVLPASFRGE